MIVQGRRERTIIIVWIDQGSSFDDLLVAIQRGCSKKSPMKWVNKSEIIIIEKRRERLYLSPLETDDERPFHSSPAANFFEAFSFFSSVEAASFLASNFSWKASHCSVFCSMVTSARPLRMVITFSMS